MKLTLPFIIAAIMALGLTPQAHACTSFTLAQYNTPQYAYAQAQCVQGADVAYVQTALYVTNGQPYLYAVGNGAIAACSLLYTNTDQWTVVPLDITNYSIQIGPGPVGAGYFYGMDCTQFDGTAFGVYAGPCTPDSGGQYVCGRAIVF